MNEQQAISLFKMLIEQVMATGGFKKLEILDEYRAAQKILEDSYNKRHPDGSGSKKGES